MSLFEELRRRNVFRVGIAYVLMGWVLLQGADFVLDLIGAPDWVIRALAVTVAIGLPIALFFAWAFEVTPEGIKREKDVDRTASITPVTGRRLDRLIMVFLAVAVVLLLADRFFFVGDRGSGPDEARESVVTTQPPSGTNPGPAASEASTEPTAKSVAVLAFDNMSPDPENEYFADGISEEILNVLAGLDNLRVIARTSAFSFKGSGATVAEIAEKLDVGYVLEGSVRRSGDRVRVTAQLIETGTESHLWSDNYDRDLDDIFVVQDEIARAIAAELQLRLTPEQEAVLAKAPTDNIEAYNQYLIGRQLWHQRGDKGLRASISALERAVALDPEFAEAWAALADSYLLLPEYSSEPSPPLIAKARDAVNRALEIEPQNAQAFTTRGYIRYLYDFDWDNAEKDFQRALALAPDYPTALQWYGEMIAARDRDIDGALGRIRHAAQLDPLAPIMWHVSAWLATQDNRFEEGVAYYEKALAIAPAFAPSYSNMAITFARMGEYDRSDEALARFLQLADLDWPADAPTISDPFRDPTLKPAFIEFMSREDNNLFRESAADRAYLFMMLDEPERAMDVLEIGLEKGDPYASHANRMRVYDPLRENPRFQAHLARMNLWPPAEHD